ncbi:MAG: flagellar hook-associated protein FlgK [Limisphaerales bacterium]
MPGLTGSISMARTSLQMNQRAIELAGHNLANVSNPAYARQRLKIQTATGVPTEDGLQGGGVEITGIEHFRDYLLDRQVANEQSVLAYLDQKKKILQYTQSAIGQELDRASSSAEGNAASQGVSGQMGLGDNLTDFFNSLQALSTNPNSQAYRQVVIFKAQNLSEKFNRVDFRLGELVHDLNGEFESMVDEVNNSIIGLQKMAGLISNAEALGNSNDVRDRFHKRLEDLCQLVDVQFEFEPVNELNSVNKAVEKLTLSIGGVNVIKKGELVEKLKLSVFDENGQKVERENNVLKRGDTVFVEAINSVEGFQLRSGRIKAAIDARDLTINGFKSSIDHIAQTIKTRINEEYVQGTSLPVIQISDVLTEAWVAGSSGTLSVQELTADLKEGDQILFSNGGTFTVSEDAAMGSSGINGTYQGTTPLTAGLTATIQGMEFFDTTADGLKINERVESNPGLFNASVGGDAGNNDMALRLARITDERQETLSGQTFNESVNQAIAGFGQELFNVESQAVDQKAVARMLEEQRISLGGVSIDEEMSNLLVFQRAFQANAKLISVLDEMLAEAINIVR